VLLPADLHPKLGRGLLRCRRRLFLLGKVQRQCLGHRCSQSLTRAFTTETVSVPFALRRIIATVPSLCNSSACCCAVA
jgi:hypothetical protein